MERRCVCLSHEGWLHGACLLGHQDDPPTPPPVNQGTQTDVNQQSSCFSRTPDPALSAKLDHRVPEFECIRTYRWTDVTRLMVSASLFTSPAALNTRAIISCEASPTELYKTSHGDYTDILLLLFS